MKLKAILATTILMLGACASDDAEDVTQDATEDVGETADSGTDDSESGDSGSDDSESGDTESGDSGAADSASAEDVTLTLVTHGSFAVSDGIFEQFTAETGITVEVVSAGDAGELVARAVLTAGQPEGDVLFGVDNTFLQRALDADVFEVYRSEFLASIPDELELDQEWRALPIDYGDVCINYIHDDNPAPTSLDELATEAFASRFVTMNPETSSPGFAFLLATIAAYGEDGWQDYWQKLADGGVTVTSGWTEAYYGEFVQGGGDKTIVTSYATSPAAEVLFADPAVDSSPTGVLTEGCFRQIEFAGILKGTEHPGEAEKLIDFMLSETFQADIPLNMFVFPANENTELPQVFLDHAVTVANPLILDPTEIEANRGRWTEEWTEIVLR